MGFQDALSHLVEPVERALDHMREKSNKCKEFRKVAFCRVFPPVYIHHITDDMEGIERNAKREHPIPDRDLPPLVDQGEDPVEIVRKKSGIFQHRPYAADDDDSDRADILFSGLDRLFDFCPDFPVIDQRCSFTVGG